MIVDTIKMFRRAIKKLESHRVIDETTGCWLWTGRIESNGYGRTTYDSKSIGVHRLSAHLWLGYNIYSSTQQVNHKEFCHNKHCFNPEHLYVGTQSQNLHDYYGPIEERNCPKCSRPLTKDNIYTYVNPNTGKTYRWCLYCKNTANWMRQFKKRKK